MKKMVQKLWHMKENHLVCLTSNKQMTVVTSTFVRLEWCNHAKAIWGCLVKLHQLAIQDSIFSVKNGLYGN